mgnify:CR=1 FL=1
MKTTITMTKTEITKIATATNALTRSFKSLAKVLDVSEIMDLIGSKEALKADLEEINKAFTEGRSGGFGTEHFGAEIIYRGDEVNITITISDELIIDFMAIGTKMSKKSMFYLGAFVMNNADELKSLVEIMCTSMRTAIEQDAEMLSVKYDTDDFEKTAWGCFIPKQDEVGKKEDTGASNVPSSNEIKEMANAISMGADADKPTEKKIKAKKTRKEMSKEELHELLCDEVKKNF